MPLVTRHPAEKSVPGTPIIVVPMGGKRGGRRSKQAHILSSDLSELNDFETATER